MKTIVKKMSVFLAIFLMGDVIGYSGAMELPKSSWGKLPAFVDLSNPEVLKEYLHEDFQQDPYLSSAHEFVINSYERDRRPVLKPKENGKASSGTGGNVFPIDPEVMAYLMPKMQGKKVLEIAGADGIMSVLFAFAGAKVYFNDIEPLELEWHKTIKKRVPQKVSERLETIEGDSFNILVNHSHLANSIDLIVCRNFIHYLTDPEQTAFFKIIKTLLKPSGEIYLTSNSVYNCSLKLIPYLLENQEHATYCYLSCYRASPEGKLNLFHDARTYSGDLPCELFTNFILYDSVSQTNVQHKFNRDNFLQMDKVLYQYKFNCHNEIREACKKADKPQYGYIVVDLSILKMYSVVSLTNLMNEHGFDLNTPFATSPNGHLVNGFSLVHKALQIGVLARNSDQKK